MRITEVNIGSEHITGGLKPIIMNRLNQCVLIAGKNGSGKSRLLFKITRVLPQKPKKSDVNLQIKSREDNIAYYQKQLESLKMKQQSNSSQASQIAGQISSYENAMKGELQLIEQLRNMTYWPLIKTDDYYDNYSTVSFVPKKLTIKDSGNVGKRDLISLANNASSIGTDHISESTFAYIQKLQDRWFTASHPKSTISNEEKEKATDDYESLKEIVQTLLGCEINRDLDGQATIFGFQLAGSNLSDGQKVILQYCIAIHAQGASLNDHILIMDEPENHLHPSILFELINKIRKYNSKGQIWIATHSVPLLAYFDPQDIWYMEDGLISQRGKVPEKVLYSLLGNEEQIERLKDFINLPAQQAIIHYAFEALFPPPVKDTDSSDPQTIQVHSAIADFIKPNGKIKTLDYGAGKGRILNCTEESKKTFIDQVDYYAFDKFPNNNESQKNMEECINSISQLYENPKERYFTNESELRSKHDEYSFDIIIMCDVLHEIDPSDWLGLFGPNGFITKSLKGTGILLLVEDHQLPHGEKAYQNGFVVLDTPEIKKLFRISSEDKKFSYDDFRGDGRLKAHRIPQPYLKNLTKDTRDEALSELLESAKREIAELRKSEQKNYKTGRLMAFWMHQMCNAELALSKL